MRIFENLEGIRRRAHPVKGVSVKDLIEEGRLSSPLFWMPLSPWLDSGQSGSSVCDASEAGFVIWDQGSGFGLVI